MTTSNHYTQFSAARNEWLKETSNDNNNKKTQKKKLIWIQIHKADSNTCKFNELTKSFCDSFAFVLFESDGCVFGVVELSDIIIIMRSNGYFNFV